jgi:hypothetical protein
MTCKFCGGTGSRYRPWGAGVCHACDGTGQEQPRWNPKRGGRTGETTRAALADGPTREHGGPEGAEEMSTPSRGTRRVAATPLTPPTPKEEL